MADLAGAWSSISTDPALAHTLMIALAGLVIAGVVKGATGIGYASCALPFLAAAIDLRVAMGLVVVPAMASNVMLLFTAGRLTATLRRFRTLYLSMIVGVCAGAHAFSRIDQSIAARLLGAVILLYGLQTFLKPNFSLSARAEATFKVPTGFLNGLITGLTGSQVIPLVPYMIALRLQPSEMVQGINIAIIVSSFFLGLGLLWSGVLDARMLMLSCAGVIPALAGVRLGTWARSYIQDQHFRTIVIIVLMLLGLMLIVR